MSNKQAVVTEKPVSGNFSEVTTGPIPQIEDHQILIKAVAYAANPTDWKHAAYGFGTAGSIAGSDASGTVEKVGKNVSGYQVGDVVSTFLHGNISATRGAFSQYVVADPATTIKYDQSSFNTKALAEGITKSGPVNTFEAAASITLGLTTVALTFATGFRASYNKSDNADKTILIWGGATATGVLAIQVAKQIYGLKVFVTASKKNHEFLQSLGADQLFDYNDADVVDQIKKAAGDSIAYGYDTIANKETFQSLYDATAGSKHPLVIDNLLFLNGDSITTDASREVKYTQTLAYVADGQTHYMGEASFNIDPQSKKDYDHFWTQVLPKYVSHLKSSNLRVLKAGLESANEASSLLADNKVSAEKVVFRYD